MDTKYGNSLTGYSRNLLLRDGAMLRFRALRPRLARRLSLPSQRVLPLTREVDRFAQDSRGLLLALEDVDEQRSAADSRERGNKRGQQDEAVTLVLTNQQIAARIGSVREVVSRGLSRLQQNGLIHIDGRRITICDDQALEVFAGG
jgi:CRP-like cAMP-binding protein